MNSYNQADAGRLIEQMADQLGDVQRAMASLPNTSRRDELGNVAVLLREAHGLLFFEPDGAHGSDVQAWEPRRLELAAALLNESGHRLEHLKILHSDARGMLTRVRQ